MKILIFGATGMVGKRLIDRAIAHGHDVRAFGRNVFEELSTERDHLELFKGYLFTDSDIKKALKGVDAVLSAIGGAGDGTDRARSLGMRKIVAQMEKRGPKRLVALGGMGVLQADEETIWLRKPEYPKKYLAVGAEHLEAYEAIAATDLDWTFVGAPEIVDADATGQFQTERDYMVPDHWRINAGDLAEFMVTELKRNEYVRSRVGIG